MIIDHMGISIQNTEESKAFYTKALSPLGIVPVMEAMGWCGFGKDGKPDFWFGEAPVKHPQLHIAFIADNRAAVDAFYAAAIAAGAKDNGAPGLRPHYHPDYYGAFVIDLNNHNIEAVCHNPE